MEKLTKVQAIELVAEIENCKDDPETAHAEEDELRSWFIECVAADMYTKKECVDVGNIVIKTKDINFPRWCA